MALKVFTREKHQDVYEVILGLAYQIRLFRVERAVEAPIAGCEKLSAKP